MTIIDILDLNMKLNNLSLIYTFLEQYCKDTVRTMRHYHGGCRIGKVVDYEYKVIGVDAL
ncbi:glucose-methanol-choline oxidoreductase, FAD/NAD(P)-binding domain protein [Artemisia annua]|uniref:Glucose-methanol-choline oxidoreductase, FAD/NAD(P)-binding domain protein n=1 Tax=Artemisia annua TaxID=35608 RepID=A0A2U1MV11_ARTAN|nr:glucose-methanol-choline oxidoreductase, FAD/NAD(P)-binding domain protein [Artemisia annua]